MRNRKIRLLSNLSPVIRELLLLREAEGLDRSAPVSYTHLFSALAHARVNVKMIDQGSSEWNIIIGVENDDFETAIRAIYDIFVITEL